MLFVVWIVGNNGSNGFQPSASHQSLNDTTTHDGSKDVRVSRRLFFWRASTLLDIPLNLSLGHTQTPKANSTTANPTVTRNTFHPSDSKGSRVRHFTHTCAGAFPRALLSEPILSTDLLISFNPQIHFGVVTICPLEVSKIECASPVCTLF